MTGGSPAPRTSQGNRDAYRCNDFAAHIDLALGSPIYLPLHPLLSRLRGRDWPPLEALEALLAESAAPRTLSGHALRLVRQDGTPKHVEERYEARIYLKGELQTRERDWHDLFNALVWATFPTTKARLNALQYTALEHRPPRANRGKLEDALTIFDEGGMIVASADQEMTAPLRGFRWKELFRERRETLATRMEFFLFGHAIMEQCLRAFIGLTAKALVIEVEPSFFGAPLGDKISHLDARVAQHFMASRIASPRDLDPVPVLGIPGWWPENEAPGFYDNERYFRSGRGADL
jgi:hypothetical protein